MSSMKVVVFGSRSYDKRFLGLAARGSNVDFSYLEHRLDAESAALAKGYEAVCVFVNDQVNSDVLATLAKLGVKLVVLRCAGFNNVDLRTAQALGVTVARVPAYSPESVAEHAVALMLTLNRKTHRAYGRVRDGNFSLRGLLGFDMNGRTAGIVGTGHIGTAVARLLTAFGMRVLASDPVENPACLELGVRYVSNAALFASSDIVSLHCPLNWQTRHLVDAPALSLMKRGVMLINTSRGAIIDTPAVVNSLKSGHLGYLGLDVYEQEGDLFFQDLSDEVIQDDVFQRLLTFPNVLITGHQGFFTVDALTRIAKTTVDNISEFARSGSCANVVTLEQIAA